MYSIDGNILQVNPPRLSVVIAKKGPIQVRYDNSMAHAQEEIFRILSRHVNCEHVCVPCLSSCICNILCILMSSC